MPLEITTLEEKDIPAFADCDDAAMEGWALAAAMTPSNGGRRRDQIEKYMRDGWDSNDKNKALFKVTDTETGKIVGASVWTFRLDPSAEKPEESKVIETEVEAPAEAADEKAKAEALQNVRSQGIFPVMKAQSDEFKRDFLKDQLYINLSILIVRPSHQRSGIGSQLVKWGCDKADEAGVISYLTASPKGYGLYLKHGFELVYTHELDLRPYGVDATEQRRWMIRQPKTKT